MSKKDLRRKLPQTTGDGTDNSNWQDDSHEQISLAMGSEEYKEFLHDNQMQSKTDFDEVRRFEIAKTQKDRVRDKHNKATDHDEHERERTYNEAHAKVMREVGTDKQKKMKTKLNQRQAYAHIKKEDQDSKAVSTARKEAEKTESPEDDKQVRRNMPKTLETLKYNDGVTEDDYLPKALRKYT
jgi:hypothetical protein